MPRLTACAPAPATAPTVEISAFLLKADTRPSNEKIHDSCYLPMASQVKGNESIALILRALPLKPASTSRRYDSFVIPLVAHRQAHSCWTLPPSVAWYLSSSASPVAILGHSSRVTARRAARVGVGAPVPVSPRTASWVSVRGISGALNIDASIKSWVTEPSLAVLGAAPPFDTNTMALPPFILPFLRVLRRSIYDIRQKPPDEDE
jgi:hypothetical protein